MSCVDADVAAPSAGFGGRRSAFDGSAVDDERSMVSVRW
jgi:hypothetical protein